MNQSDRRLQCVFAADCQFPTRDGGCLILLKGWSILCRERIRTAGTVLLAAFGEGFSEGVDLPGGLLPQVFLIVLPLPPWNLEVKAFHGYYRGRLEAKKGENVS